MSDAVATRVLDSGFKVEGGKKGLSLGELYDTLQASIWSDLKGAQDITLMRRNLQREHVRKVTIALTQPGSAPADMRALQRENARALVAQLKAVEARAGMSKEARAHVAESRHTLEEALRAPMHRVGA
jgi:hypothetical protein